jgi:hypothetical protein
MSLAGGFGVIFDCVLAIETFPVTRLPVQEPNYKNGPQWVYHLHDSAHNISFEVTRSIDCGERQKRHPHAKCRPDGQHRTDAKSTLFSVGSTSQVGQTVYYR